MGKERGFSNVNHDVQIVVDFAGKTPQYHARSVLLRRHPMERRVSRALNNPCKGKRSRRRNTHGNEEKGRQEKEALSARRILAALKFRVSRLEALFI